MGLEGGEFLLSFDARCTEALGRALHLPHPLGRREREGVYDPGEEWKYVIPLYDDRVFGAATDCVYYYEETSGRKQGNAAGLEPERRS